MATTHYNFPTIVGTDTIDGVNAINGLANSVDAALFGVAGTIPSEYELPIAGTTSLGGVRGSGDIYVNPSTGDMTINNNVITSAMIQSNAIAGSDIQTGSITSAQLASTVTNQLSQGTQAYTAINTAPKLFTTTDYVGGSGKPYLQAGGTIYSNYVVNETSKMVQVKVSGTNCVFKLPASNTMNSADMLAELFTLPAQYRPTTQYNVMMFAVSGSDKNLIIFFLSVTTAGKVGITHVNYSADKSAGMWADGSCCFMYGAVRQS